MNDVTCTGEGYVFKNVIRAPQRVDGITAASIFTTACAYSLRQVTKSTDIVFGLVVTGRSTIPPGLQDVIGPCINIVPVRLSTQKSGDFWKSCELLQAQRAQSQRFETIGIRDIIANCTDWPRDCQEFKCVVQFQDIEENPTANIAGTSVRLDVHHRNVIFVDDVVSIFAIPKGDYWEVTVSAAKQYYTPETIAAISRGVENFCNERTYPSS
jgi:hypothetical protein